MGEWSVTRSGQALIPKKGPPVPIRQKAGWASELVLTQRMEKKSFASAGDRTPVDQSVVRHNADLSTAAPCIYSYSLDKSWEIGGPSGVVIHSLRSPASDRYEDLRNLTCVT
jgi:hypothetical protein